MGNSTVIQFPRHPERGDSIEQIHAQLMACHEALHVAALALGHIEAGGDLTDFGPPLRVVERSAAQLDKLVDALDSWHVRHWRELPSGA